MSYYSTLQNKWLLTSLGVIIVCVVIISLLSLLRKIGGVCLEKFETPSYNTNTNPKEQNVYSTKPYSQNAIVTDEETSTPPTKPDVTLKPTPPKSDVTSKAAHVQSNGIDARAAKPVNLEWRIKERFGDDIDINLVMSGLNDCYAVIGTGDGKRDLYDFSDRFITAQFDASNDIKVFSYVNDEGECK